MRYPTNYISITQSYHEGLSLDFGYCNHKYQDIMSIDDGIVLRVENQITGGKCVFIQHNTGIVSLYAHLDSYIVKKGQNVSIGQKIGSMGQTGTSAKSMHLHLGIYSKKLADKGFTNNGLHGNSDIDPFKVLYVYPEQDNSKVKSEYKIKMKDKPKEEWTIGTYELTKEKYIRKSPKVALNRFKVKELKVKSEGWTKNEFKMLVSQKGNDYAKLRKGSILQIVKISKEGKNIWGKYGNYGTDWVCLCDSTGAQAKKK